ncbi:MAG: N-acetyltransferase [Paludibacteraceae bacterium]|nr:N-acetyltransferase [Paludibacteraceae bacterium]
MDNLTLKPFSGIELKDHFFDSLRDNYEGFDKWFQSKAQSGAKALVYYDNSLLKDFLYLKDENEELQLDGKTLPAQKRLKVGTFKIERRGTNRGERFMKRILDVAIQYGFPEIYVTMFDDTDELMHLRHFFETYGFSEIGRKSHPNGRSESVLLRDMTKHIGNIVTNYPFVNMLSGNKYLLSIKPEFHTKLFPDSILQTERYSILQDVSPTNSINKIYICWMHGVQSLKPLDKVIIYRTSDGKGYAIYRSVATSVCTVSEVKTVNDFTDIDDFIRYVNKYSVFKEHDLRYWYNVKPNFVVIKMLYNIAFQKKVIRKDIIEQAGIPSDAYWGFQQLNNEQFNQLLTLGNADGRYIVN